MRPLLGCSLNDQRRLVRRAGLASLKGLGFSRITSVAGLSVRKPKNTGWRISHAAVHSVNFTSATSFGLTQLVLPASGTFWGIGFLSVISGTRVS